MPDYYVNKNKDREGNNEVHRYDCHKLPYPENRKHLGDYTTCQPAVAKAKSIGYPNADGCRICSYDCHTG